MVDSWKDFITTGRQLGWPTYTTFYHVTPKSRVPSILKEGLKLPSPDRQALSNYIENPNLVPGIYLDEDRAMILHTIAGVAMERGYTEPLTLLAVWVKDDLRLTSDPDGPPGSIVVLDQISPELISVAIDVIEKSMTLEEP